MSTKKPIKLELYNVKNGQTVVYKTDFLSGRIVKKALEIARDMDTGVIDEAETLERLLHFVTQDVYKGKFTEDQLLDGTHAPELMPTLYRIFQTVMGAEDSTVVQDPKLVQ